LTWIDRALFVWLYRGFPRILNAITILRPEMVVRWHRKGFAAFWRWKSRPLGGRPQIDKEVRDLIRRMSSENPLWGAPHIHGELLKLGFDVAQSTVSKYMVPRRGRPSQTWKTFLHNHADGIASIDLFVVPTIAFEQLFAFLVLGHGRRQLLWFAVTRHPTAEWLARQITEAFPWDKAPTYIVRDNDRAFGSVFRRRSDDLHPAANVKKMRSGTPLTDADRLSWLRKIAEEIDGWRARHESGVLTCSALKRFYRDIIIGDRSDVTLVYLKGSHDLIHRRMAARHEHFMPIALLDSQFATLQEPTPDEHALIVDVGGRPIEIATEIVHQLEERQAGSQSNKSLSGEQAP
jgi:carbohydrate kinase (thermoresistant glucokinase family)